VSGPEKFKMFVCATCKREAPDYRVFELPSGTIVCDECLRGAKPDPKLTTENG